MTIPSKTPRTLSPAAASTAPATPLSSVASSMNVKRNEKGQSVGRMSSASAELSSSGSRKRPPPQSFDPIHVQHRDSSQKQKPSSNPPAIGHQDGVASLKPSIHQSEASTKATGCQISVMAKSQFSQTKTSPAVQTKIEDVVPDSIQEGTREGLPPRAVGIQGAIVSVSTQEERRMTSDVQCDDRTTKNVDPSKQLTCSIDVNFLQQIAVAFKGVEGNTRLAKESISLNPSLQPTFLAICEKYGNIIKDCPLESSYMLTSVLEVICKVVQELQKKDLTKVDRNLLDSYHMVVNDATQMKVNVDWLRTQLDEIKGKISYIFETQKINDEKNKREEERENEKKDVESMKAELEKLKSKIDKKESQMKLDTLVTDELSRMITARALKIQQYQNMPLMEAFP